ncbi:MAG: hypothetical protein WKF94_00795 [Solirubrobacteraceae bacterium]
MTLRALKASAENHYAKHGQYSLSFWSLPDADVGSIVRHARSQPGRNIPHGGFASTAGVIRDAGFDLVATPPPGHYAVDLPDPPTDADYERLMQAFSGPVPNPEGRMPNVPSTG